VVQILVCGDGGIGTAGVPAGVLTGDRHQGASGLEDLVRHGTGGEMEPRGREAYVMD
jgi:hypothetical protein